MRKLKYPQDTNKPPPAGTVWADMHGDLWTMRADGTMLAPETGNTAYVYVLRRWGPLLEQQHRVDRNARPCEVVVVHFVRWSQTCGESTNLRIRDDEGVVRAICGTHLGLTAVSTQGIA